MFMICTITILPRGVTTKMNKLKLWYTSNKDATKKAMIGTAIGILCVALIGIAVWIFTGPLSGNTKVNWQMNGTLVTADGTVKETMELSIVGKIHKDPTEPDILTLDITLPDDFPYSFKGRGEYYSIGEKIDEFCYYVCNTYTYSNLENTPALSAFAIDEEKGWALFLWPDCPGQYLVASTDGTDPQVILSHFQAFIDTLPKGN